MVALLLGRWKILAAVLADVAEMPGSALPAVHREAQEDVRLPALLSRGASVSEAHGEPLKVFVKSTLTSPSMPSRVFTSYVEHLAAAAHEDSLSELSMAPLVTSRLLGRVLPPLPPSSCWMRARSAW